MQKTGFSGMPGIVDGRVNQGRAHLRHVHLRHARATGVAAGFEVTGTGVVRLGRAGDEGPHGLRRPCILLHELPRTERK